LSFLARFSRSREGEREKRRVTDGRKKGKKEKEGGGRIGTSSVRFQPVEQRLRVSQGKQKGGEKKRKKKREKKKEGCRALALARGPQHIKRKTSP